MSTPDTKDEMISRIVAAYAGRSDVSPQDIVSLFNRLRHEMAAGTGTVETPSPEPQTIAEAAIPLERAMTRDKVYCLCCGKGFKMLKRHIGAEHGLTEAEYRARFGLAADVPLVAPSYSSKKAKYAKETGFGKYARRAPGKNAGMLNRS